MTSEFAVSVPLDGGRSYEVLVGRGARSKLAALIAAAVPGAKRCAIVTEAGIGTALGDLATLSSGIDQRTFTIPGGEAEKTLETVGSLCSQWSQWGLTRSDVVVGLGGGIVTDVAGFTAASYHRGMAVIHVSTTLLGMIDAAVGGKTGVNIPEGKNLIGAFWQPSGVICDTELLATLPERQFRAGLGEMAKYHVIDPVRLPVGADSWPIEQRVAACVEIKAEVVAGDEREAGRRAILNYGHTLGHALETATEYSLRHGEAIAIGMVFAAELAESMGRISSEEVARQRALVASYGLSDRVPAGLDPAHLVALMARDKKATNAMTFVLDGPAGVETVTGIEHGLLLTVLERMN